MAEMILEHQETIVMVLSNTISSPTNRGFPILHLKFLPETFRDFTLLL